MRNVKLAVNSSPCKDGSGVDGPVVLAEIGLCEEEEEEEEQEENGGIRSL